MGRVAGVYPFTLAPLSSGPSQHQGRTVPKSAVTFAGVSTRRMVAGAEKGNHKGCPYREGG